LFKEDDVGKEDQAIGSPGAGQAPVQSLDEIGQPVQPEYVTRQEAEQMAEQAAENAFRRAQSLIDQRSAKVQEQVKALKDTIALQREAGIEITDAQEKAMVDKVAQKALLDQSSQLPTQPAQAGAGSAEPDTQIDIAAGAIMDALGVEIIDSDPKEVLELLDMSSETAYLKSIPKAIAKKRELAGQPASPPQPQRAPTNIGAGGNRPNPIQGVKDPTTLLEIAFGEKR
jgi:hypothetical protein